MRKMFQAQEILTTYSSMLAVLALMLVEGNCGLQTVAQLSNSVVIQVLWIPTI